MMNAPIQSPVFETHLDGSSALVSANSSAMATAHSTEGNEMVSARTEADELASVARRRINSQREVTQHQHHRQRDSKNH